MSRMMMYGGAKAPYMSERQQIAMLMRASAEEEQKKLVPTDALLAPQDLRAIVNSDDNDDSDDSDGSSSEEEQLPVPSRKQTVSAHLFSPPERKKVQETPLSSSPASSLSPSSISTAPKSPAASAMPKKNDPMAPPAMWIPPDFNSWIVDRQKKWMDLPKNPNKYYYSYCPPGVVPRTGKWTPREKQEFAKKVLLHPVEQKNWGYFAMMNYPPGRTGEQFEALFKSLSKAELQQLKDAAAVAIRTNTLPMLRTRTRKEGEEGEEDDDDDEDHVEEAKDESAKKRRKLDVLSPSHKNGGAFATPQAHLSACKENDHQQSNRRARGGKGAGGDQDPHGPALSPATQMANTAAHASFQTPTGEVAGRANNRNNNNNNNNNNAKGGVLVVEGATPSRQRGHVSVRNVAVHTPGHGVLMDLFQKGHGLATKADPHAHVYKENVGAGLGNNKKIDDVLDKSATDTRNNKRKAKTRTERTVIEEAAKILDMSQAVNDVDDESAHGLYPGQSPRSQAYNSRTSLTEATFPELPLSAYNTSTVTYRAHALSASVLSQPSATSSRTETVTPVRESVHYNPRNPVPRDTDTFTPIYVYNNPEKKAQLTKSSFFQAPYYSVKAETSEEIAREPSPQQPQLQSQTAATSEWTTSVDTSVMVLTNDEADEKRVSPSTKQSGSLLLSLASSPSPSLSSSSSSSKMSPASVSTQTVPPVRFLYVPAFETIVKATANQKALEDNRLAQYYKEKTAPLSPPATIRYPVLSPSSGLGLPTVKPSSSPAASPASKASNSSSSTFTFGCKALMKQFNWHDKTPLGRSLTAPLASAASAPLFSPLPSPSHGFRSSPHAPKKSLTGGQSSFSTSAAALTLQLEKSKEATDTQFYMSMKVDAATALSSLGMLEQEQEEVASTSSTSTSSIQSLLLLSKNSGNRS